MPRDVARVVELISNAVRTEILRHLVPEPLTAMELADRAGIVHSSIYRHLVLLEEYGLVVADHPQGQRGGKAKVRWSTNPERVREVAEQWAAYATGGPVGGDVDAG